MPSQKEEQQAPKEKNETIKDGEQKEEQENRNELDSDTDSDETDSDSDLEEIDLDSYVQSYLESEKKPEEEEEEEANDFYITEGEEETDPLVRPGDERPNDDNTRETNIRRFTRLLNSKRIRKSNERKDAQFDFEEDKFDFPEDPEKWTEEDLKELWADAPTKMTKPGWDPVWADDEDWKVVREEVKWGRDPLIAPFYVPYRKPYPAIPDNNYDVSNPKAVIEELDRIEEFLTWVSYIFADGSSYEGTVWDDLAHGKGVYIAEQGLVRYEGEWLQNDMDGHGVVEVDIPDIEPVPGSELEAEMRAEGKIISRDFMSPEDKKWLEMDIEDSLQIAGEIYEIPFYENDEWVKQFGKKPEKGRYRYAGQWKLGRMHGCGVYEVNERTIYGRFYFGELVEDSEGCDEDTSALHAGLAEVAAAKARMFVNKPDGMVREERGPYSDPQHPYFYEEEDVWMAPGFINQFYEVPDYWKTYVHEIDQEREMWLNSFYKSPFRIPMPAELEYWWEKDEPPEYVLVNKEPVPDPEDPSKLIYTEDPLILHTPTGRLINYTEDEEHGVRLFWQPPLKEGEEVDLKKVEFLPLGFDEFYGRQAVEVKDTIWMRLVKGVENKLKPLLDKVEKWTEAKKKASEKRMELYEKEMELIEAELCLEEAIEEMDEELKMIEKEEEKKTQMGLEEEDTSTLSSQDEKAAAKVDKEKDKLEVEEEEDEEEEDDNTPSSFGSVYTDENPTDNDQKGKRPGDSPFSSSSLLFASCSLVSSVPSRLRQSFFSWKPARLPLKPATPCVEIPKADLVGVDSVSFPVVLSQRKSLRARVQAHQNFQTRNHSNGRISQLHSLPRILYRPLTSFSTKRVTKLARAHRQSWQLATPECHFDNILSLHTPVSCLESYIDTIGIKPHCDLL